MATSPVSYFENLFVIVELLKPVTKNFDPTFRSALNSRKSWIRINLCWTEGAILSNYDNLKVPVRIERSQAESQNPSLASDFLQAQTIPDTDPDSIGISWS